MIRRSPLRQDRVIDIANWPVDHEFETFPQGARDKTAVFAPTAAVDAYILPGRRYLFKESRTSKTDAFKDQFWAEVVAYRVGCLLALDVPPAFAAIDSRRQVCAALIQWFYADGVDRLVHAGDLLQNINPQFDRKLGAAHNLDDNKKLLLMLRFKRSLSPSVDWRMWWANALLLDALIGNTDRHQDNWGFLYRQVAGGHNDSAELTPYFDNGTSMGSELSTERAKQWRDPQLDRYIERGTHHVRWAAGAEREHHVALLTKALMIWPRTQEDVRRRLVGLSPRDFSEALQDLTSLTLPVPFTKDRFDLSVRLLSRRLHRLQDAIL
jgi:hypothetical protein